MNLINTHAEQPTDPNGVTGELSGWLAGLRLEDVPEEVRVRGKHVVLDGLVCALVGARLPWSRRGTDVVRQMENEGRGTLIGTGETTSVPGAVLLNGAYIQ